MLLPLLCSFPSIQNNLSIAEVRDQAQVQTLQQLLIVWRTKAKPLSLPLGYTGPALGLLSHLSLSSLPESSPSGLFFFARVAKPSPCQGLLSPAWTILPPDLHLLLLYHPSSCVTSYKSASLTPVLKCSSRPFTQASCLPYKNISCTSTWSLPLVCCPISRTMLGLWSSIWKYFCAIDEWKSAR